MINKEDEIKKITTLICGVKDNAICFADGNLCDCKCVHYHAAKRVYDFGYRKLDNYEEEMKEINKTLAERDELKEKIDRLEVENEKTYRSNRTTNYLCFNCKKSVKEFAEKLKDYFKGEHRCYTYSDGYTAIGDEINEKIDELLKEYEE